MILCGDVKLDCIILKWVSKFFVHFIYMGNRGAKTGSPYNVMQSAQQQQQQQQPY